MWERAAIVVAILVIWLAEGAIMMRIERARWRFSMGLMFVAITVLGAVMFFAVQFR